jgi:hypothetical protein
MEVLLLVYGSEPPKAENKKTSRAYSCQNPGEEVITKGDIIEEFLHDSTKM